MTKSSASNDFQSNGSNGNGTGRLTRSKFCRRQYKNCNRQQQIFTSGAMATSTPVDAAPENGIGGVGFEINGPYSNSSSSSTCGNGQEVICGQCMTSHPEFQQCCSELDSGLYSIGATTADSLSPGNYGSFGQNPPGPAFFYPSVSQHGPGGVYILNGVEYNSTLSPTYSDFEHPEGIFLQILSINAWFLNVFPIMERTLVVFL